MSTSLVSRLVALLTLAVSLALGQAPSRAGTSGVRDGAGFFSETAERRAETAIADLKQTAKKDLLVETLARIPSELTQGLPAGDKAAMNRFFEKWSVEKAREHKVDGIYVLITKDPSHLQVAVGNETERKAFTQADRKALVDTMLGHLRAKRPDDALLEGVSFVGKTVGANLGSARPKASASSTTGSTPSAAQASSATPARESGSGGSVVSWGVFLIFAAVLVVGFMIVVRILRAIFGGRGRNNGMQGGLAGAGAGGGGFMRSLLGGIFGAAAGMWLYDAFTG
ncbi:MAG: TPM domain-containing protein, partial [Verrucomicrobiales bacterium]|nr:TPM domain-containing protein [Verrucomicrobiales bacterium]